MQENSLQLSLTFCWYYSMTKLKLEQLRICLDKSFTSIKHPFNWREHTFVNVSLDTQKHLFKHLQTYLPITVGYQQTSIFSTYFEPQRLIKRRIFSKLPLLPILQLLKKCKQPYLDLSKAFDLVAHDIFLIKNLHDTALTEHALKGLKKFTDQSRWSC